MSNLKYRKLLQIFNIIAFFLTLLVNGLSGLRIFNGNTIADVSEDYENLFTPAGLTFSIWGVIYTFLLIFVFYQARDFLNREQKNIECVEQINVFFIISCILNGLWIITWLYELILLSLIVMILLLFDLIIIYLRLNIAKADIDLRDKVIVWIPFSLYLGWISVATVANTTVFLVSINWNGFGLSPLIWTLIVIIMLSVLTLTILYTRKDLVYPLVLIWTSIGIILRRIDIYFVLFISAILVIVTIALNLGYFIVRKYVLKKKV
ncbi:MAG: hypothetical protein GF383_02630 [Candidatus Lokiarchaeota archaeon]|nr:hypothetical protein [Candidatus Lokiarchaeota archaeon]MBD3338328.1 hypothetical protein [Candidatus Lokiarchaeota archaeon]